MESRMDGKVAVITGASSGIGEGTARLFVEHGAKVVLADIDEERGARITSELGANAVFTRADVTSETDISNAVDLAVAHFGGLDVMFNNAGILGTTGSIAETSIEDWDHTMAILLRSVFLGVKHASRIMIPQRWGAIVSTTSTAGVVGGLGPHVYTTAKHAIIGLTRSGASELSQHGVRINAVAPGNTVSAMTAAVLTGDADATDKTNAAIASRAPLGIAGEPQDIAEAVLYLASDAARYVTGHCLVVDSGQTSSGMTPNRFHGAPRD